MPQGRYLQYDLGISYQTAWNWCREMSKPMEYPDTRCAFREIVDLDDTCSGVMKKSGKVKMLAIVRRVFAWLKT